MEPLIRNIADTALWVAVYRADETERADALFHDPYARMLAGERGQKIVDGMEAGRKNSWSFIARTWLFDEFILQHVQQGYDMIINLASGLDTRPYRLALPATLTWVDVDLPEMTGYMQTMMAAEKPNCELERVGLDLSDRMARLTLFNELGSRRKKILVVAEGLIGYLDESDAGALAYDLSHQRSFRHWVLDLMSPGILPLIQQEMGVLLEEANSPLLFAPEEGEDFFQLFKWKPVDSRSKLKTAAILNRLSPEMMAYAALPEPKGPRGAFPWSGVCLFENMR
jgi:O-methyltransferase involved in polyketide biosynthesis